jgi:hypothetical protein
MVCLQTTHSKQLPQQPLFGPLVYDKFGDEVFSAF